MFSEIRPALEPILIAAKEMNPNTTYVRGYRLAQLNQLEHGVSSTNVAGSVPAWATVRCSPP